MEAFDDRVNWGKSFERDYKQYIRVEIGADGVDPVDVVIRVKDLATFRHFSPFYTHTFSNLDFIPNYLQKQKNFSNMAEVHWRGRQIKYGSLFYTVQKIIQTILEIDNGERIKIYAMESNTEETAILLNITITKLATAKKITL